jgi:uncharacterized repeat protein (TIGR01451 family)
MRSLIHRAVVVAGAVAVVLVAMAGVASASGTVTLGWSPSGTVSYGTLNPGATGAKVFTLTNTGTSATSALNITLTPGAGTPASAFTVTADHCTSKSLGPGKSCTVTVSYTAPAGFGQSSQATLTATGPGKPAVTAPVTLTGATPKATPAITTTLQPASPVVMGTAIADQATVTGGDNPTGTVTFLQYDHPNCGSLRQTIPKPLSGGVATLDLGAVSDPGTVYWVARYNGDAHNNLVTTGCNAEPVTITKAQPAITTTASAGGPAGKTTVTDTATISGGYNPTGTLTFNLYGPASGHSPPDCSGTPVDTETVNVTGDGSYPTPAGATPAQAGTYWWTASYSGDANNQATGSGCGADQVTITGDLTLSPGDIASVGSPNTNDYEYIFESDATQTFTITNNGNSTTEPLQLQSNADPGYSIDTGNCPNTTLDPGQTCTFDVTFTTPGGCPSGDVQLADVLIGGTTYARYVGVRLAAKCP